MKVFGSVDVVRGSVSLRRVCRVEAVVEVFLVSSELPKVRASVPCAQVGLLDVDICGPSAPKMLGVKGQEVHQSAVGWDPVYVGNLAVISARRYF